MEEETDIHINTTNKYDAGKHWNRSASTGLWEYGEGELISTANIRRAFLVRGRKKYDTLFYFNNFRRKECHQNF